MKTKFSVFAGRTAIVVMVFYYFIPFLIVAGASDGLARLRPILIATSFLLVVFGAYRASRMKKSNSPISRMGRALLWYSALAVLGMVLFSQAIANFLASLAG